MYLKIADKLSALKFRRPIITLCLIILVQIIFTGCAFRNSSELWNNNVLRTGPLGFQAEEFVTPPFHLAGLLKVLEPGDDLVVYLEGDGRGVTSGRVNDDPTPHDPMTLDLAIQDPAPRVLYLARIGQFMPAYATPANQVYWSSGRLAPQAIEAATEAIDQAKLKAGAKYVHLVGFSGGGGLAILLAESRKDVLTVVTVAGLLDTDWWVKTRNYYPLLQSLNPAERAVEINKLPQIHFYGTKDNIIPPEMSMNYAARAPFMNLQRVPIPTSHGRGWKERWKTLLEKYVLPLRSHL